MAVATVKMFGKMCVQWEIVRASWGECMCLVGRLENVGRIEIQGANVSLMEESIRQMARYGILLNHLEGGTFEIDV